MLKVIDFQIGMIEVPDEISLTIGISNCPFRCPGCHTPLMQEDVGVILKDVLDKKIIENIDGITCVCFLGGDIDLEEVAYLSKKIKENYHLKTAIYLGAETINKKYYKYFDFIKLGQYKIKLGGLDSINTNQRFYEVKNDKLIDITYRFQKNYKE